MRRWFMHSFWFVFVLTWASFKMVWKLRFMDKRLTWPSVWSIMNNKRFITRLKYPFCFVFFLLEIQNDWFLPIFSINFVCSFRLRCSSEVRFRIDTIRLFAFDAVQNRWLSLFILTVCCANTCYRCIDRRTDGSGRKFMKRFEIHAAA